MKTQHFFIDLTQRPPRSFRVRLGNYVVLARMLDKGRATLAGKNGEYICNSPTDQRTDAETLASFVEHLCRLSKTREDVKTLFEFGELDDYVSFGGKA